MKFLKRIHLRAQLRAANRHVEDHCRYVLTGESRLQSLLTERRRIQAELFKAEHPTLMQHHVTQVYSPRQL